MSRRFPAEHLRREEVLALLDACGDGWVGARHRALIVLMWRGGLRLGEALALRQRDVDFTHQTVRVLHGKGDKTRTVGLDRRALKTIDEWILAKKVFSTPVDSPLICTRRGGPISQSYVRRLLPRLARRAGIDRRVHAHMLRHTFAVELSREGVPPRDIQILLGHTSLATTTVYLQSLSPEEALSRVRGREW